MFQALYCDSCNEESQEGRKSNRIGMKSKETNRRQDKRRIENATEEREKHDDDKLCV